MFSEVSWVFQRATEAMKPGTHMTEWTEVDTVLNGKTGNTTRSLAWYQFCRLRQYLFSKVTVRIQEYTKNIFMWSPLIRRGFVREEHA